MIERIKLPPDKPEFVGKNAERDLFIWECHSLRGDSRERLARVFELSVVRIWQIIAKGDRLLYERDLRIEMAA